MLAINNEPDDVDALHDAGEVIEALPKRGRASMSVRRKLAHDIGMKEESGGTEPTTFACVKPSLDHFDVRAVTWRVRERRVARDDRRVKRLRQSDVHSVVRR